LINSSIYEEFLRGDSPPAGWLLLS